MKVCVYVSPFFIENFTVFSQCLRLCACYYVVCSLHPAEAVCEDAILRFLRLPCSRGPLP
jgi:hypothetical protein